MVKLWEDGKEMGRFGVEGNVPAQRISDRWPKFAEKHAEALPTGGFYELHAAARAELRVPVLSVPAPAGDDDSATDDDSDEMAGG